MTQSDIMTKVARTAKALGACAKTDYAQNIESMAELFFSPQGREFCLRLGYPGIELWREIKAHTPDLEKFGIYVDAGNIAVKANEFLALIGNTYASVEVSGCDVLHHIIAMHKAFAVVTATDHAVIATEAGDDCTIKINTYNGSIAL